MHQLIYFTVKTVLSNFFSELIYQLSLLLDWLIEISTETWFDFFGEKPVGEMNPLHQHGVHLDDDQKSEFLNSIK